jgi:hypothetical protein
MAAQFRSESWFADHRPAKVAESDSNQIAYIAKGFRVHKYGFREIGTVLTQRRPDTYRPDRLTE